MCNKQDAETQETDRDVFNTTANIGPPMTMTTTKVISTHCDIAFFYQMCRISRLLIFPKAFDPKWAEKNQREIVKVVSKC